MKKHLGWIVLLIGILALILSSKTARDTGYKACVSPEGNTWEQCNGR